MKYTLRFNCKLCGERVIVTTTDKNAYHEVMEDIKQDGYLCFDCEGDN